MSGKKHLSTNEFLERYRQGERTFEHVYISGGQSLQGITFQGIVLRHVTLHEVNLIEANMEGAFQEVNLQNAKLRWAQLHEADLRKASIQGADLSGAGFSRTDVRGANLSRVLINNTDTRTMIRDALTRWEPIDMSRSRSRRARKQRDFIQHPLTGAASQPTQAEDYLSIPGLADPLLVSVARKRVHQMLAERFRRSGRSRQAQFRAALLQTYAKRCAVTGCQVEETLEAAHIIPFCLSRNCDPWNGILLRSDLHRLFDLNLMRIDPLTTTVHFEQSILSIDPSYQTWEGHVVKPPQAHLSFSSNPYE